VRLPGKPINDQQVKLYMRERRLHTQTVAAARAGFSERTARRIDADPNLLAAPPVDRVIDVSSPAAWWVWERAKRSAQSDDEGILDAWDHLATLPSIAVMVYLLKHYPPERRWSEQEI
jgi:hypothetical protein